MSSSDRKGLIAQHPQKNAPQLPSSSDALRSSIDPESLYLELLKKCLTDSIYDDGLNLLHGRFVVDPTTGKVHSSQGIAPTPEAKRLVLTWPSRAHTMVGTVRLDNLQFCVETVLREGIAGDLIEAGGWRGGASIFMRGVLKAHGDRGRKVWVADSFEGLPPPDLAQYDGLVHLYPKLQVGGFAIIDDYNAVTACNEAVRDYRSQRGIADELIEIEGSGAFWRKTTA